MKRRKFFKLAGTGVAGLTLAASCSKTGKDRDSASGDKALPEEAPAYRKGIKSAFSSGQQKSASDRIVVALIGAGNHGVFLILQAANLGENIFVKYLVDNLNWLTGIGFEPGGAESMVHTPPLVSSSSNSHKDSDSIERESISS